MMMGLSVVVDLSLSRKMYVKHLQFIGHDFTPCSRLLVSSGFVKQIVPYLLNVCYNGSLVT